MPGALWTIKKLQALVATVFALTASHSTLWAVLDKLKLSWKKTKKLLGKADRQRRAEYAARLPRLYAEMCAGKRTIIYIDEAHIQQDMDLGYGWAPTGKPFHKVSKSPGLHAKINWYGAYDFTNGRAFIWAYERCNGEHTADFLSRVAAWTRGMPGVTIIWDGAPVHRAHIARDRAEDLGLELIVLPPYSPDLNPIEGLWKWLRESVTQGRCHDSLTGLFQSCKAFIATINTDPEAMVKRLWPKFDLDDQEEKLLVSN